MRYILWCFLLIQLVFASSCFAGSYSKNQYGKTLYPIVMVGGAAAFDSFQLGVFKIDYWFGITDALRNAGAEVYVTDLSGFASNEDRADELYSDLLAIKELSGAEKINIFAHSQGALVARMATKMLRDSGYDVVVSVTTFAGMNKGTHISPWARQRLEQLGVSPGSIGETLLEAIVGIVGTFFWESDLFGGSDGDYSSERRGWQSLLALEKATDPERVAQINEAFPDGLPQQDCMTTFARGSTRNDGNHVVNGVHYYSYGAHSNGSATSFGEYFDPIYVGLALPLQHLVVNHYSREFQWDGLVPQCGHKLGKFIGSWKMNHFDAVGHFAGIKPSFINDLYLTQANRLKNLGL